MGDWDLGFETMVLFTRYITHISLGLSNADPYKSKVTKTSRVFNCINEIRVPN